MNDHDIFFQHRLVDISHLEVDQEHLRWWQQRIEINQQHSNQQSLSLSNLPEEGR
jgi:hypothetical protein